MNAVYGLMYFNTSVPSLDVAYFDGTDLTWAGPFSFTTNITVGNFVGLELYNDTFFIVTTTNVYVYKFTGTELNLVVSLDTPFGSSLPSGNNTRNRMCIFGDFDTDTRFGVCNGNKFYHMPVDITSETQLVDESSSCKFAFIYPVYHGVMGPTNWKTGVSQDSPIVYRSVVDGVKWTAPRDSTGTSAYKYNGAGYYISGNYKTRRFYMGHNNVVDSDQPLYEGLISAGVKLNKLGNGSASLYDKPVPYAAMISQQSNRANPVGRCRCAPITGTGTSINSQPADLSYAGVIGYRASGQQVAVNQIAVTTYNGWGGFASLPNSEHSLYPSRSADGIRYGNNLEKSLFIKNYNGIYYKKPGTENEMVAYTPQTGQEQNNVTPVVQKNIPWLETL